MARPPRINTFKPAKKTAAPISTAAFEITIDSLADDGRGLGRLNNKVVFVEGGLPAETVKAYLVRRHKRFDEAKLVEVLIPSIERVEPLCSVYEACGGCQLQHLAYSSQLKYKQQRLQKILAKESVTEVLSSSEFAYRHRARLSYSDGVLGFKARASHNLVSIDSCPLLQDQLNSTIAENKSALVAFLGGKAQSEISFTASADGRVAVAIHKEGFVDSRRAEQLADAIAAPAFLHSVQGSKGKAWQAESSPLWFPLGDSGHLFFQAGDFTQVNIAINQQIIRQCLEWLAPKAGEVIADYFCGLGNFSLAIAASGAQVLGYDVGRAMIARANARAVADDLPLVFTVADLFEADNIIIPAGCHKAIIDPPRAGAKVLCEAIAASKQLSKLIYVSCDPATLNRDLTILIEAGFTVREARFADMFPQTHHMESLVYLQRG
jgi:23S rRNA (uracil1939-C5)-methyltransferase